MEWITAIIFYIVGTWVGSRFPIDLRHSPKEVIKLVNEAQAEGYRQGYEKGKEEKRAEPLDLRKE